MLSTLIALFFLQSSPVPQPAPSRAELTCVKACERKAEPCYAKCESGMKKCLKLVPEQCAKKTKDAAALKTCKDDGERECKSDREINCDGQCGIAILQCMHKCEGK